MTKTNPINQLKLLVLLSLLNKASQIEAEQNQLIETPETNNIKESQIEIEETKTTTNYTKTNNTKAENITHPKIQRNLCQSVIIRENPCYDNAGNRFIKKTEKELTLYLRHGQIAVAMDIEISLVDNTTDIGSVNRYVLSGDLLSGRVTKKYTKNLTTMQITNTISKEWYCLDHLGSTKTITDQDGKRTALFEYRSFGDELRKIGLGNAKYKFQGKELDKETNLQYFNARYYDSTIGRFISVDPIQSGTNWYVAFGNNPLNRVDPTGLESFSTNYLKEFNNGTATDSVGGAGGSNTLISPNVGTAIAGALITFATLVKDKTKDLVQEKEKKDKILVSHYTSIENAKNIMASQVIKPGYGEAYVYVMLGKSSPKEAEKAGALYTDARIEMKVNPNEIMPDIGKSEAGKNAFMFVNPGAVQISNKEAKVEKTEKRPNLFQMIKDTFKNKIK